MPLMQGTSIQEKCKDAAWLLSLFMSFLGLGFAQSRSLKFGGPNRAKPHVLRDDVKTGQMIRHKYQCQDQSH